MWPPEADCVIRGSCVRFTAARAGNQQVKGRGQAFSFAHQALPKPPDHGPAPTRPSATPPSRARETGRCADERTLVDLKPGGLVVANKGYVAYRVE